MKKGTVVYLLVCLVSIALYGTVKASPSSPIASNYPIAPLIQLTPDGNRLDANLQNKLDSASAGQLIPIIVRLNQRLDLAGIASNPQSPRGSDLLRSLQETAAITQTRVRNIVDLAIPRGEASGIATLWILNGLALSASPDLIHKLAALPEVISISADRSIQAPRVSAASDLVEANISLVHAPYLWNLGFRGQGVVVASMDTGVDISHPDLSASWRGGADSWYDPYGEHPDKPADANGHGTWTMGVMVGQNTGGTTIGIAPDAKWIAAKIFNDQGSASVSNIHQAFQWVLDPDGNPETPDAPDIVNNSWDFLEATCDLEFEPDIQALRAAGILPVFAAGNSGPSPSTSSSPANNPGTLAVGAVDNDGVIYPYSSRGPTDCGASSERRFPDLVAPGVNIRSTDIQGGYSESSGTSLSAPHVSGVLALLFSAYPDLSLDEQEAALIQSGQDLGASGPDGVYGNGQVDAQAAYEWLKSHHNQPFPTGSPTLPDSILPVGVTPTPTRSTQGHSLFLPFVTD